MKLFATVIIQCIGNNGGLMVLGGSNIVFRGLTLVSTFNSL